MSDCKASYNKTLSSFHVCFAAVERTLMIQHMLPRSPVGAVLFVGTMLVSSSPFDPEITSSCTGANLAHLRSQLFDVKLFPNGVSESRSASRKRNVKTDSSAAERSLKQTRVLVCICWNSRADQVIHSFGHGEALQALPC